jgi:hypothetical protein
MSSFSFKVPYTAHITPWEIHRLVYRRPSRFKLPGEVNSPLQLHSNHHSFPFVTDIGLVYFNFARCVVHFVLQSLRRCFFIYSVMAVILCCCDILFCLSLILFVLNLFLC